MTGSQHFQIVQNNQNVTALGRFVVTGSNQPIGEAYDYESETAASLANGKCLGHLSRAITTNGPSYENLELGLVHDELKSGSEVSLWVIPVGAEVIVEGPPASASSAATTKAAPVLLVTSGTGAITAATAKDTRVSFKNGRFYAAQSGDLAYYRVLNAGLSPLVDDTYIRVRMERIASETV